MPSLQDLPDEILEHALLKADVQSIFRCRQVSKRVNDLISTSIFIQYKIELALDSLQDGPPSDMIISERLQALRTRRAAWDSGQFIPGSTCLADHSNWAFSGTHLAWMRDSKRLEVTQVPCTITGVPEKSWSLQMQTISVDTVQGLAIDPAQDLLVLMTKRRATHWAVEVRSLSTGQRHPDALQDSFRLCEITGRVRLTPWARSSSGTGYWLHTIAQHIHVAYGILHEGSLSSKLVVYNWRTGAVVLNVISSSHFGSALMSDRYLLLAHHDLHDHFVLSIVDLCAAAKDTSMNDEEATDAKNVDVICVLEYPIPPSQSRTRCAVLASGPPYSLNPVPQKVPFHTRPERLFSVTYLIFPPSGAYQDFVTSLLLSTTLEQYIQAAKLQPQHRFTWNQWGSEGTRLLPLSVLPANLSIYGASLVTSSLLDSPDSDLSMFLQIYDLGRPGAWNWPTNPSNPIGAGGSTLYDSRAPVPIRSPVISFHPEYITEFSLRNTVPLLGENCIVLKSLNVRSEECRILSL